MPPHKTSKPQMRGKCDGPAKAKYCKAITTSIHLVRGNADWELKDNIAKREQGHEKGSGSRTKAGAKGIDGQKAETRRFDRAIQQSGEGGRGIAGKKAKNRDGRRALDLRRLATP